MHGKCLHKCLELTETYTGFPVNGLCTFYISLIGFFPLFVFKEA